MNIAWMHALLGGMLIGLSVSLMLLWNGRVTGISGIINGLVLSFKSENHWRVLFLVGLVSGGFLMKILRPELFSGAVEGSWLSTVIAGLLVGFGTIMGSGCTSGHGVCGISRLSLRSLVATIIFIIAGIAAVYIFKNFGVLA